MIADWMLERYRVGELSAVDAARVAAELSADESLQARLKQLDEDDAATLAAHPPARVAARVERVAVGVVERPAHVLRRHGSLAR